MSDVWVARINRYIEKLFNVKGGPTLVDIDPSIKTVLSLQSGVEERYLIGWNRYAIVVQLAAVAAQAGAARIRNPVGSNMIAVLEQLTYMPVTTFDFPIVQWGATVNDLVAVASTTFTRMDPRGQPQPTSIISSANSATLRTPPFNLQRGVVVNTTTDFINTHDQQIPILPGNGVDIQSTTLNLQFNVAFMWRERPLETSELT